MNPEKSLHDDPRLTAYALGELDGDEARDVESWIAASAEARQAVDDIRRLADSLTEALQIRDERLALSDAARRQLEQAAREAQQADQHVQVVASSESVPTADAAARKGRTGRHGARAGLWISALSLLLASGLVLQIRFSRQNDARRFNEAQSALRSEAEFQQGDAATAQPSAPRQELLAARQEQLTAEPQSRSQVADEVRLHLTEKSRAAEAEGELRQSLEEARRAYEFAIEAVRSKDSERTPGGGSVSNPVIAGTPITAPQSGMRESGSSAGVRSVGSYGASGPQAISEVGQPAAGDYSGQDDYSGQSDNRGGYIGPIPAQSTPEARPQTAVHQHSRPRFHDPRRPLPPHPHPVPPRRVPLAPDDLTVHPPTRVDRESYRPIVENPFRSPTESPLSTFSIDVDTGAYANVRRFLNHGQLPPRDAVRIEELINYFEYSDAAPQDARPFSATLELGTCPWNGQHRLLRIGLRGREIDVRERPPSNLVFLLDVSGSMRPENKLPLVKQAMRELAQNMREDDQIAIVTYAGQAGLVLPSTTGDQQQQILDAIDGLSAGGSTNGEAGIRLAYQQAVRHFIEGGSNRVLLCSDGDFNVGLSSDSELVQLIQDQARNSGVFLSVFGFGMGNLKDSKLEQLADHGNGHYGYIDALAEAQRVFGQEMTGTLYTIAKDVKVQIEFNPAHVGAYRLIGYENRVLAAEDFADDLKDAGEIGAGHSVTALYEIVPAGGDLPAPPRSNLKYQPKREAPATEPHPERPGDPANPEWLTVKLRYKQPDANQSSKLEFPLVPGGRVASDFDWAAAVAGFGLLLRDSQYKGTCSFPLVQELALSARGADPDGRRAEFLSLVHQAHVLYARQHGLPTPVAPDIPDVRQQADQD